MTKREFIGHCQCSSRFRNLITMIETYPLDEVIKLRQLHNELSRNPRYSELEESFVKRLGV